MALKYLSLTIAFMFLSAGVLVAGFLDVYEAHDNRIFRLLLPMTLLFISAVVVNDCILIPKLLLKSRYGSYCAGVVGVICLLSVLALYLEYEARQSLCIPMRITDYSSPWIIADMFGNSLMLSMMLLGLGLLRLYDRWKDEVKEEKELSGKLESYIQTVNERLNLSIILEKIENISQAAINSPDATATGIRNLSEYLREQLYELPEPPVIVQEEYISTKHSSIADWLVSERYRTARHVVFLSILAIISCGAFFNAPDNPEFTFDRLLGVLSMFGIFVFIAYVNILWLYPRFMKRGNVKRYAVSVALLLIIIVSPMIALQIFTYEPNIYTTHIPAIIAVVSTVGSVLTLFLFIGGISSALVLKNWMHTNHRMTLLKAETMRQKYAWLRKQINPHFLFNVLNNIGICAYDSPELTAKLLGELQYLLKYQLLDLRKETTTLKDECAFIGSYFALESTRHDKFDYILECEAPDDTMIHTLLFIPFVENAVKYSTASMDTAYVEIIFTKEQDKLRFVCKNLYNVDKIKQMNRGGIGVSNTIQRLRYIYSDCFEYNVMDDSKIYMVDLKIPLI